jgi:signal transduction histidine kinase/streptogramin lyase
MWIGYSGQRDGQRVDHWTPNGVEQFTNVFEFAGARNDPRGLVYLRSVRSVFVDRDRQLWVGTYNHGLLRLQDGRFPPAPGSALLNPHILAIHQDRQGKLWVGTEGGLGCWDGESWRVYSTTNGLSANAVQAIAADPQGNLWLGTAGGGINRLKNGRFTWFGKTNGLPSDTIGSLWVDADGVLWAGTSGGLARWKNGQWTRLTALEGLTTSNIGYLIEDGQGYLWIGSNIGLMRIRKEALDELAEGRTNSFPVRTYDEADGLATCECSSGSQPAACRTPDGRIWFPTIQGLVSVDPAQIHPNTNQLPVVIESVLVAGKPVTSSRPRALPLREVILPPGKQGLEIRFTSLNLAAADRARFKYRLTGHEWSPANDSRVAYYGKLPPGHYLFQVTACNEDGVWNEAGCSLAVTVLPPFWRTAWFLTLSGLCFLGLIAGSVHYVSTQKLQRELALMRQHEALEAERARIARDLHDQLGANLTQVTLLGEMAETDKDLPTEVEGHARQITQTARETTRALDEIVWTVNPANDTLDGLVNYVCKYAQEYVELAGLRYRIDVPDHLPATPIPPELRHNVFLVAKEAINNVVKHAKASSVWLRLQLEPNRFTLEIQDDGRGLSPEAEKKGRNGLRNMRKRMEDVGGTFTIGPATTPGTLARLSAPLRE